ncbi:hypothetical protein [Amycolatopsis sp. CA-230715]|uniref:hypothetical protein n=1 Tax=Amycolatopsis sp. CA-230715 TaxID=2745196 RepID=UPI001C031C06|nr:hypothetical protein [Amycolatopsis sp. CA-230715]QWF85399.1 hypothetical protein HUW46_08853 [Amycolatopsis sp. CA-230715]
MSDLGFTVVLIGMVLSLAMVLRVAEARLRQLDRARSGRAAARSTRSTVDG